MQELPHATSYRRESTYAFGFRGGLGGAKMATPLVARVAILASLAILASRGEEDTPVDHLDGGHGGGEGRSAGAVARCHTETYGTESPAAIGRSR